METLPETQTVVNESVQVQSSSKVFSNDTDERSTHILYETSDYEHLNSEQLKDKCKEFGIVFNMYRSLSDNELIKLLIIASDNRLELSCYTKEKLIDICKKNDIKKYSALNKSELEAYIMKTLSLTDLVSAYSVRSVPSGSSTVKSKEHIDLTSTYMKMLKSELLEICNKNKIKVNSNKNKQEIVDCIIANLSQ